MVVAMLVGMASETMKKDDEEEKVGARDGRGSPSIEM